MWRTIIDAVREATTDDERTAAMGDDSRAWNEGLPAAVIAAMPQAWVSNSDTHGFERSAVSIILLHNHPSGDPTPSKDDIKLTRQLAECGRLLELRVHDHVVIGRGRYTSLAERGIL